MTGPHYTLIQHILYIGVFPNITIVQYLHRKIAQTKVYFMFTIIINWWGCPWGTVCVCVCVCVWIHYSNASLCRVKGHSVSAEWNWKKCPPEGCEASGPLSLCVSFNYLPSNSFLNKIYKVSLSANMPSLLESVSKMCLEKGDSADLNPRDFKYECDQLKI